MAQASLQQRILATCRGREFNTVDDLAVEIPEASYDALETTVIGAIRQGRLHGFINRQELFDGSIVTVSGIRG